MRIEWRQKEITIASGWNGIINGFICYRISARNNVRPREPKWMLYSNMPRKMNHGSRAEKPFHTIEEAQEAAVADFYEWINDFGLQIIEENDA